jgi:hypothetical protein
MSKTLFYLHETVGLFGIAMDLPILDHESTHTIEMSVPTFIFQEFVLRF